ncbi:uncharacterized protein E0L32_003146 [Thyridium curvatum]|uniref:Uncharacterized protein n=1 Tax=Thyridium curvatum TaxID=1093900 RepID=A0A507BD86_9PEZI|nr:uncharacterized protein E0L32_003146 [Thyridium curvatum]TPX17503.1 hypothetical protein E0L32_003146 [Thyridium curvatum]
MLFVLALMTSALVAAQGSFYDPARNVTCQVGSGGNMTCQAGGSDGRIQLSAVRLPHLLGGADQLHIDYYIFLVQAYVVVVENVVLIRQAGYDFEAPIHFLQPSSNLFDPPHLVGPQGSVEWFAEKSTGCRHQASLLVLLRGSGMVQVRRDRGCSL